MGQNKGDRLPLLFSYLIESFLAHLPDALMAGGGYYLNRFTSWAGLGGGLLIAYTIALIGMHLGGGPFDWWGPAAAAIGVAIAHVIGSLMSRRR